LIEIRTSHDISTSHRPTKKQRNQAMMLDLPHLPPPPPPHRFVPLDESLSSDAPGYELVDHQVHNGNDNGNGGGGGPVCWKCHGGGGSAANKPRPPPPSHDHQTKKKKVCVICHGSGRLPTRQVVPRVGKVTRGRQRQRRPARSAQTTSLLVAAAAAPPPEHGNHHHHHHHSPPRPVGYQVPIYGPLVQKATQERVDIMLEDDAAVAVADADDNQHPARMSSSSSLPPIWWPRDNEELCNLVGEYRILQKYKSHRWTTDDLVTAVVAAKTVASLLLQQHHCNHYQYTDAAAAADATSLVSTSNHHHRRGTAFRYCDLGTGNASVLQMVLYRCHDDIDYAVGVEARREALGLARRSLAFNIVGIGDDDNAAAVAAADADADAALPPREQDNDNDSSSMPPPPPRRRPMVTLIHEDFRNFPLSSTTTTTPPNNSDHHHSFDLVTGTPPYFAVHSVDATTTIIQQGAMPSSLQSAPARCEFRGGVAEYCQAAVRLLRHNGRFVCCENYANHARALRAMVEAQLHVERLWYVRGKVGRDRLFVVYVARPRSTDDEEDAPTTVIEEHEVSVRDGAGEWTEDYQNDFLRYMDIID
jgi:tRNA1(Val) A37 N6-methylase TrmN6